MLLYPVLLFLTSLPVSCLLKKFAVASIAGESAVLEGAGEHMCPLYSIVAAVPYPLSAASLSIATDSDHFLLYIVYHIPSIPPKCLSLCVVAETS